VREGRGRGGRGVQVSQKMWGIETHGVCSC
jgi:hypothetical protein